MPEGVGIRAAGVVRDPFTLSAAWILQALQKPKIKNLNHTRFLKNIEADELKKGETKVAWAEFEV